ncbi:MAG: methylated-DNA--[protein]-cysteine S-methyltransferase [Thomasclavelia sp.]|nr:methylated-DNA--[protein]-cysteine S-methyltransferase [Thomasclavelia sp.]
MKNSAIYKTKYGNYKIVEEDNLLIEVTNTNDKVDTSNSSDFTDWVINEINEYFMGKRKTFDIPYKLQGTSFQRKVYEDLATIPYGQTRSYKDIANLIGYRKAYRAVGNANNHNPIAIIIPCHRVIGSNGKLVGYASGLELKEALLTLERGTK